MTDESGWAWFIPLHNGTISVGVVLHQDIYSRKRKELRESGDDSSLEALYHSTLDNYAPDIKALLGEGELQESGDGATIKQASDFSYNAPRHAGPRYRVVGDAGGMLPSTIFHYFRSSPFSSVHRPLLLFRCSPRGCWWPERRGHNLCRNPRPLHPRGSRGMAYYENRHILRSVSRYTATFDP